MAAQLFRADEAPLQARAVRSCRVRGARSEDGSTRDLQIGSLVLLTTRRHPILSSEGSFRSGRHPRTGLRKSGLRPAWSPRYRAIPCRAPCREFRSRKGRAWHHALDEVLCRLPCPRLLVWEKLATIVERRTQRRKSRMM